MLFPVLACASSVEPKDKYLNCNCHITPGLPWKGALVEHKVVHHHHKAAKKAEAAPPAAPVKHKKRRVAHKETQVPAGEGYPGRDGIVSSNKLALPAGKSIYSSGQLVYISGRVLDMKCVPVSDAIVEIWQADPEGHYVKSTLAERLSPAPAFAGSGRATTDNLGRFNFVTTFPGTVAGRAPFIHVRVVHKDFPALDTEMFFADDTRNSGDPVYSSLSPDQQKMLTAKVWQRDVNKPNMGLGVSWDISLNGKNPYRHF
jgi:protocatechuate 3,4-dioxygenase beta subunit